MSQSKTCRSYTVLYCEILLSLLATETLLASNARNWFCIKLSLRFQVFYQQNYQQDFFHRVLSRQFSIYRKLLDQHVATYVPCISSFIGRNVQKVLFVVKVFSIVKLIFLWNYRLDFLTRLIFLKKWFLGSWALCFASEPW